MQTSAPPRPLTLLHLVRRRFRTVTDELAHHELPLLNEAVDVLLSVLALLTLALLPRHLELERALFHFVLQALQHLLERRLRHVARRRLLGLKVRPPSPVLLRRAAEQLCALLGHLAVLPVLFLLIARFRFQLLGKALPRIRRLQVQALPSDGAISRSFVFGTFSKFCRLKLLQMFLDTENQTLLCHLLCVLRFLLLAARRSFLGRKASEETRLRLKSVVAAEALVRHICDEEARFAILQLVAAVD